MKAGIRKSSKVKFYAFLGVCFQSRSMKAENIIGSRNLTIGNSVSKSHIRKIGYVFVRSKIDP